MSGTVDGLASEPYPRGRGETEYSQVWVTRAGPFMQMVAFDIGDG